MSGPPPVGSPGESLETVFDAALFAPHFVWWSLLGLVPLGIWLRARQRREPAPVLFPVMAALLLVGLNILVNWDIMRVRAMLRTGDGVQTLRGPIARHWVIQTRERDWNREGLHYRTTISEGFDIGTARFSWNRGDSFSEATFSNSGEPAVVFNDGQEAEVTWFRDEASQGAPRIVRLKLGKPAPVPSVTAR